MRQVETTEVLKHFEKQHAHLDYVDKRLEKAIIEATSIFLLRLEDQAAFLSLIWHEIDKTRLLTPGGERTLNGVIKRMADSDWTLRRLAEDQDRQMDHDPDWFQDCLQIDDGFDWQRFNWIVLVLANDCELKQSPSGSFYIYDGCHRALVLAKRLLMDSERYRPVEALLILPRPSY